MKKVFRSIRLKLFFRICIVIIIIMFFLIVVNNAVLETFFYYKQNNKLLSIIEQIKNFEDYSSESVIKNLDKICLENDIDIVIINEENIFYKNTENFIEKFLEIPLLNYDVNYSIFNKGNIMYSKNNTTIIKASDINNGIKFIISKSYLDNGNNLYIRVPISSITEYLQSSNQFLVIICIISIICFGVYILIITKIYTKPIIDLREMTDRINNFDFSKKFIENKEDDEINELGKNINNLSEKLEETITKLRKNNLKLERDIEEKSKIDEMRKQFISDVSHELKTPISLIQGYAEGLIENVNKDEENKNFYASVILDEANKMDKLVKRLLELMKLENEEIIFNNSEFDIVQLINTVIRNSKVITDQQNIKIEFNCKDSILVLADDFYIEQVISNYYTNAIKNVKEIDGEKIIKITINTYKDKNTIRVNVFNTGNKIEEDHLNRIWNRFYKVDKSRNRSDGGTGVGLALVKAIMQKNKKEYGVENKSNGVEFYFEI